MHTHHSQLTSVWCTKRIDLLNEDLILVLCPKLVSDCETSKGRGQSVADAACLR